jgi:hypothetical protein
VNKFSGFVLVLNPVRQLLKQGLVLIFQGAMARPDLL